jgi:hypothetical protein
MLENISKWTNELNPVLQGILGSAIFASTIWIGREFFKILNDLNTKRKTIRLQREIMKIVIHKKFVNSNGMYYFTQGFLLVIFKALYNLFLALIIYFTGNALMNVIHFPLFDFFILYFVIQELLSGLSWLNPKWGEKNLLSYDQELVKYIEEKLTSSDPFKGN